MEKLCKVCNQVKDLGKFSKHSRMSDGYLNMCKSCKSAYDKKRREEKREDINKKAKEAYKANIEKRREMNRNSYYKHVEKRKEAAKEYRENNKEKYKKYFSQHHQDKKEDETYIMKRKLRKHEHRQKQFNTADGTITVEELKNLKLRQNDQCGYCGTILSQLPETNVHLDHIVPLSLGGAHTISNVVFACSACNLSKNNTHPDIFGYPQFVKH